MSPDPDLSIKSEELKSINQNEDHPILLSNKIHIPRPTSRLGHMLLHSCLVHRGPHHGHVSVDGRGSHMVQAHRRWRDGHACLAVGWLQKGGIQCKYGALGSIEHCINNKARLV